MYKRFPRRQAGAPALAPAEGSGCDPVQRPMIVLELSDRAVTDTHR
jgi:hypothetical protein